MKIVIDSSVWIAGIGSKTGYASQIIEASYKNVDIEIYISSHILDEIALNLEKKLKFERSWATRARQIVKNLSDFEIDIDAKEEGRVRVIKYKPDKSILALCNKIQADYLITFDRKHLLNLKKYGLTQIVEPKIFNEIIRRGRLNI